MSLTVFRSLAEVPEGYGPTVATIGNFDGVHCGHRKILAAVVEEARLQQARAVAITFDPHPEQLLSPERAPKLITPLDERLRLLESTGIDAVLVLPFDAALAALPARAFVTQILVDVLQLVELHEGGNFRFGCRAEAGVNELRAFGAEFGFALHVHEAVQVRGLEVSSSAIRAEVAAGCLNRARWMLGRPFAVLATQKRDRGVGTELLVPTINLSDYDGLLPAFGVYVTHIRVGERAFQAVTNVGNRPTFAGAGFSVETHILNFEPVEITAQTPLDLEFLFCLRGEKTWPSPEALKAQIFRDVARAKRYFQRVDALRR
ncbi:riboflavin biosynthesis protein RibF [Telmatobacter bradus]|uniref:riboflavin biosynthesis protein RibF n=1 Tax=Telmatobacter bradus TaxID=474953 RepID=UPI003B430F08